MRALLGRLERFLIKVVLRIERYFLERPPAGTGPKVMVFFHHQEAQAAYLFLRLQVQGGKPPNANQLKVGKLLSQGLTIEAVAKLLGKKAPTVDSIRQRLYTKLGIHNRSDLPLAMLLFADLASDYFAEEDVPGAGATDTKLLS